MVDAILSEVGVVACGVCVQCVLMSYVWKYLRVTIKVSVNSTLFSI